VISVNKDRRVKSTNSQQKSKSKKRVSKYERKHITECQLKGLTPKECKQEALKMETSGYYSRFIAERGSNTSQMETIAENCGLATEHKAEFYKATNSFPYRDWKSKACYANSQQFFIYSNIREKLNYREGFHLNRGLNIPIQHSWLEYDDGTVLDLTYGYDQKIRKEDYQAYWTPSRERAREVIQKMWLDISSMDTITAAMKALTQDELDAIRDVSNKVFLRGQSNV
jgi:hypothetical protein